MPSHFLIDCVADLREKFSELHDAFVAEYPGWSMPVVCTHRSPEEQFEIYKEGREQGADGSWHVVFQAAVKTNMDGTQLLSLHNDYPARALDVEIHTPRHQIYWDEVHPTSEGKLNPWLWCRAAAPRFGLLNGGMWKKPHDCPHFQLAAE
jgi:hypothetical protein